MNVPARLVLYGAVLLAVFAGAFIAAGAVVPEHIVQNGVEETAHDHMGEDERESGEHETDRADKGTGDDR